MQVFQEPRLASAVGQASEQRCIAALLERLLDPRSAEMEEGPALVKALNVLMLKVLEHCDRTASFESLLRLLATPPATVAADADAAARASAARGEVPDQAHQGARRDAVRGAAP